MTQVDLDYAPIPRRPELRIYADVIGFDLTVPQLGKVAVLVRRDCSVEVIRVATDTTVATGTFRGGCNWDSTGHVEWHADKDVSVLALDMVCATVKQALYAIVSRYSTREWLSRDSAVRL